LKERVGAGGEPSQELMKSIQKSGKQQTQQLIHFFAGLSWPPAKKG